MPKSKIPKEEIIADIKTYKETETLAASPGGKRHVSLLLKSIASAVDTLASSYRDASHTELIALSARLAERLAIYRMFINAPRNSKLAEKELEQALADDESDTEE